MTYLALLPLISADATVVHLRKPVLDIVFDFDNECLIFRLR
jgi:hypothetical protein